MNPTLTVTPAEITIIPFVTPAVIGTIVTQGEPRLHSSHLSPDGKWRAEVVIYYCVPVSDAEENAFEQLKIIPTTTDSTKLAASQLQSCGGLGAFGLAGLFWSPNSRYFYYTNAREGFPDGCGYWAPPILRFDMVSAETEYLGGGNLSTDETMLATWQGQDLVVWDINEDEIARMPAFATNTETGSIAWSPDSQGLVYLQVESYCPISGMSYVVSIDLPERSQTILLESETPSFGSVTWENPGVLHLHDENGDKWSYTLATNELMQEP